MRLCDFAYSTHVVYSRTACLRTNFKCNDGLFCQSSSVLSRVVCALYCVVCVYEHEQTDRPTDPFDDVIALLLITIYNTFYFIMTRERESRFVNKCVCQLRFHIRVVLDIIQSSVTAMQLKTKH